MFVAFYLIRQTRHTPPPRLKGSTFQPDHTTERSRNPHGATSICANSHWAETCKKKKQNRKKPHTLACDQRDIIALSILPAAVVKTAHRALCSARSSLQLLNPLIKTECPRYFGSGPSSHHPRTPFRTTYLLLQLLLTHWSSHL